jgi:hypothetical protein
MGRCAAGGIAHAKLFVVRCGTEPIRGPRTFMGAVLDCCIVVVDTVGNVR